MKIKHFDQDLGEWVIAGASNASNIELTNPAFTDENGNSISTDQGFTKLYNKIAKLEDNLAWVYLNGALGGGGGPGPGAGDSVTIDILGSNIIYTSTGTVKFEMMVNSGSARRSFDITIWDRETKKQIASFKKYSLSYFEVKIDNLTKDTKLEITAIDSNLNQAVPAIVNIIYGSIKLILQQDPPSTISRTGLGGMPVTFLIQNGIYKAVSSFSFFIDGKPIDEITGIEESELILSYSIRDIIFNSGIIENTNAGKKYTFEAYATTDLEGTPIRSEVISFNVTIVESDSLTIITEDIGETPEEATLFSKGTQIKFDYLLSYRPSKYTPFTLMYKVYLADSTGRIGEPLLDQRITANKGILNTLAISTARDIPETKEGQYIEIELSAFAVDDPTDDSAKATKSVYALIGEADETVMKARNDNNQLLAYYSNITNFPNTASTLWNYAHSRPPATSINPFPYNGVFFGDPNEPIETRNKHKFYGGVNLHLVKTNGKTTGFMNTGPQGNTVPGIVLNGESHAYIESAHQMFPDVGDSTEVGFFHANGFNISLTYKTEDVTDTSGVVMSIGDYDGEFLRNGIEISLASARLRTKGIDSLEVKLPVDELITVDIDVSREGSSSWYFKIYVNGVLSAVSRIEQKDIDWKFEQDLYFGCRNDKGILSRFANVTIHDIKIYTAPQTEVAIVQNYISATEQARLLNGVVDPSLDAELRTKNMFTPEGECLLWDYIHTNDFLDGASLYTALLGESGKDGATPYPIVKITETSNTATNFKINSSAIFSPDDKENVMSETFACTIEFKSKGATTPVMVRTPSGISSTDGVRIGLQGTSSLTYNAKNFEIYMGMMDDYKQQLFLADSGWLPENQFTLKADVMDSAHVNNVVIGKIINGEVTDKNGTPIVPLVNTPPMRLAPSAFPMAPGQQGTEQEQLEHANNIQKRIKHTSDGFPCLLFIEFAPEEEGSIGETQFMGIYNFNLGRHAQFNLGLKILENYDTGGLEAPAVVTDYNENASFWNKGQSSGVHSMEINQNNSRQGAFQQDDRGIVEFMADSIYTSVGKEQSYSELTKFYTQTANMALIPTDRYEMDLESKTPTKLKLPRDPYTLDKNLYYNFDEFENHASWENLVAYNLIIYIFGMVDSVTKNLTLRHWEKGKWYPAFYDMDTAFGLNNAGQDIVEYWAHLHKWRNISSTGTPTEEELEQGIEPQRGVTTYTRDTYYPHDNEDGVKQYYASYWSRLWEIVENLPIIDRGELGEGRVTLERLYLDLRQNLFPDPDQFIEDYYTSYTDQTGSILFNYDYRVKYLKIAKIYDSSSNDYKDNTDFSQLKFLHGNRVVHVKDWFKKRLYFLDSVYGVNNSPSIKSPIKDLWANNKATGTSSGKLFTTVMQAPSKIIYKWASGENTSGAFWIEDSDTIGVVPAPGGETIINMWANKYITKFENFKEYKWTGLGDIDMPLLKELDLSGLTNMIPSQFIKPVYTPPSLTNGVYKEGVGLKSIEDLNLSRVRFDKSDQAEVADYSLDVSNCLFLKKLDISYSDITDVKLSDSAVLKHYDLSGTAIRNLVLKNQAFLEYLILDGCENLETIEIENCNSLTNIRVPNNVKDIKISNCELLSELSIPYTSSGNIPSNLVNINVNNCPGLKSFSVSGQNNPGLHLGLVGMRNIEHLDFSNTSTEDIILPPLLDENNEPSFTSLKSLDISHTKISNLIYNDMPIENGEFVRNDYLDLVHFPYLENIRAANNTELREIRSPNNPERPVNLRTQAFINCGSLRRAKGHYNLAGQEVFKGCGQFKLNEDEIYTTNSDRFFLGDDVTNISIETSTMRSMFEDNSSLSYDDFKKIVKEFNMNITSLEDTFKGCRGITGPIWTKLFTDCRNVNNIKGFLQNTRVKGIVKSSAMNYSAEDEETWGFLDFLPKLLISESAFESSLIEWIDNRLFHVRGDSHYSLANIDKMFSGCYNLKVAKDTWGSIMEEGELQSIDFFIHLKNLIKTYPSEVFSGCQHVNMRINNDELGNTYLFHVDSIKAHPILTNSLYTGVNLLGEIKVNVFGGISSEIGNYRIPKFTTIIRPFAGTGSGMTVHLTDMGDIFKNISDGLMQAVGIFSGMETTEDSIIPNNIFTGCGRLNSIAEMFSNLNITNNGEIYEFPHPDLFKDTVSLTNISSVLAGTNKMCIKLIGEGFKNCKLTDVSSAFARSGVFGTVPYRLFFMEKEGQIQRSIEKMSGVFNQCWLLGYTSDRTIDEETILETIVYEDGSFYENKVSWADNIASIPGKQVTFKLDTSKMVKTFNYELDERLLIDNPIPQGQVPNPEYDEETNNEVPKTIPDPEYKDIIDNPDYNPGEYAFDSWYLDGYGWEGAETLLPEDAAELEAQKNRLYPKFFKYDDFQKQTIADHERIEWYIDSYQNYAIPTDLFRYCSKEATLTGVLEDLTWYEKELREDLQQNKKYIETTERLGGLVGRVPMRLLESLVDNEVFDGVFRNTLFSPFYGLREEEGTLEVLRGLAYPVDLLKHNKALREIPNLFYGTSIEVGTDINPDLFDVNTELRNVSNVWSDVKFDSRPYDMEVTEGIYPQVPFREIFNTNTKITNASGLFMVVDTLSRTKGLHTINVELLSPALNINSISSMFANNVLMVGAVPVFNPAIYRFLNSYDGYLTGIGEGNITNSADLGRLRPLEWGD